MIPIPLNIPQKPFPGLHWTRKYAGKTSNLSPGTLPTKITSKASISKVATFILVIQWQKKKIEYQHWHGWHRHQIRSVQTLRLTTNTTTISEHIYAVSQQWRTNGVAGIVFIKYRHTRRRWGLISEWNDTRNRPDSQCSSSRHHRHSFISL